MLQDSILSPTLFNCYVSALMKFIPKTEDNFTFRYADDHALINSFLPEMIDIFSALASDLACIIDWKDENEIKMNTSKTRFIVFRSKIHYKQILSNTSKLMTIRTAKTVIIFFGTYLDGSLNIKAHTAIRTKNDLYNTFLIKKSIRRYIIQDTAKGSYVHLYFHSWTILTQFHRYAKSYPYTV